METNYTLKRLKYLLPVFTLLMLTSFLVNAQEKADVQINDNDIELVGNVTETFFCGPLDEVNTVSGTLFVIDGGTLDLILPTGTTGAIATFTWQYSITGTTTSWVSIDDFPGPGTLVPIGVLPATVQANGITVTVEGYDNNGDYVGYHLEVDGIDQTIYLRRVITLLTDDPGRQAINSSEPVLFEKLGDLFVCEDENVIDFDGDEGPEPFVFCGFDEDEIVLTGTEIDEICIGNATTTVTYEWRVNGDPIPESDTKDYTWDVSGIATGTYKIVRFVKWNGEECGSNTLTFTFFDEFDEVVVQGDDDICLAQDAVALGVTYTADFDLLPDYPNYAEYTYLWQINATYGSLGAGAANTVQVQWDTVTPDDESAWVSVKVTTPDGCVVQSERLYVDINRQPEVDIKTDDEQVLCLLEGTFDDDIELLVIEEGDHWLVGAIKLDANFSVEVEEKQSGQWTKDCGPDNVVFVVPTEEGTDPNPFVTETWELAPEGAKTVWAVIFFSEVIDGEIVTEECFDLNYRFMWTEFGQGQCQDDYGYISVIFYVPYLEVEALAYASDDTDQEDSVDQVCDTQVLLVGTVPYDYCTTTMCGDAVDIARIATGTWTVISGPEGADLTEVEFDDKHDYSTTVTVIDFGTYEFEWRIEQPVCEDGVATVEVTFEPVFDITIEADEIVCNNFNPQGTWASAMLKATVVPDFDTYPYEGIWTTHKMPAGANEGTFVNEDEDETKVLVTSLGTYTFRYTVTTLDGECKAHKDVTVTFLPDIKDVALEAVDAAVCSLAVPVNFRADYDPAQLSGFNNEDVYLSGDFKVQKGTASGTIWIWEDYDEYSTESYIPYDVDKPASFDDAEKAGTVSSTVHIPFDDMITFRFEDYGRFRIVFNPAVTLDGERTSCVGVATLTYDAYWKPTALIVNEPIKEKCGVASDVYTVTIEGNKPRGTYNTTGVFAGKWTADDYWNISSVRWLANGTPIQDVDELVYTLSNNGLKLEVYAMEQGIFEFTYEITNEAGGCSDIDVVTVAWLELPVAGIDMDYEYCGYLSEESDDECEGWGRVTRYGGKETQLMAVTGSNHDTADHFIGYWEIDIDNDIITGEDLRDYYDVGYIGRGERGPWTPVVGVGTSANPFKLNDWIKINGELLYKVHPTTGLYLNPDVDLTDPNAMIEVSRHGEFTFTWVTENVDASGAGLKCDRDTAKHVIYFKNTPLARDIRPIQVEMIDGKPYLASYDEHPFIDCLACDDEVRTYYMLERPIVEQTNLVNDQVAFNDYHSLVGTFNSTVPAQNSIRWRTTVGDFVPSLGEYGEIVGGQIIQTYALKWDATLEQYRLVDYTEFDQYNKHHIALIEWFDTPREGVIKVIEENTVTECLDVHSYTVTKVSKQVVEGPEEVDSFSGEHQYSFVDLDGNPEHPIPGVTYTWEIEGDEGSFIERYYKGDKWHYLAGQQTEFAAEGAYMIEVYWKFGLDATEKYPYRHGIVYGDIKNTCHDAVDSVVVKIRGNMIAGQLKYWNQEETYMPSPFKFHPNNIPDYFYVRLYESRMVAGEEVLTPIETTRVIANTDDESPFFGARAFFEFDGLDLTKNYRVKVWDGGFSYLEEDLAAPTDQNYLSYTYTWNGWDGVGVTATDALAALRMSIGVANLYDPAAPAFWWTGDVDDEDTPYGFFTHSLADVNSSGNLSIVDIQQLLFRTVGTFAQFANNTPNFRVAARFVETFGQKTFGTGDELTGFTKDEDLALYTDLEFQFIRENNAPYEGNTNPNRLFYVSDIFDLDNSENFMNIYYAAVGDVASRNSTPVGGGVVKMAGADLEYKGQIEASVGDVVTIPVRVSNAADIAAITIGLTYDNNMIEVLEVDYEYANIENEVGRLRVADISTSDVFFGGDETILNVTARILSEMDGEELFTLDPITEFANSRLQVLDITLNTVAVKAEVVTSIGEIGVEQLSLNNYPNPFSTSTTIEYTLPEAGNVTLVVYNRMGQVVATLVNETQEAGRKSVELNSSDLGGGEGIFIYRITVEGSTRTFTGTGNLMLMK